MTGNIMCNNNNKVYKMMQKMFKMLSREPGLYLKHAYMRDRPIDLTDFIIF